MKELTIEEKAQRYDEALKVAKGLYAKDAPDSLHLERMFPELKESEESGDEKMRKSLAAYFAKFKPDDMWDADFSFGDIVVWFEKQSKKPDTDFSDLRTWKYIVDAVWTEKEGIGQYLDSPFTEEVAKKLQIRFGNIEQILANSAKTCKDEQKPANSYCQENCKGFQETGKCFADGECKAKREAESIGKVELKFHEGEWITNGDYTWEIVEVKPLDYILQSQDGNIVDDTISYIDEQFHSFTIEDAKPGDVLVCKGSVKGSNGIKYKRICLFNNLDKAFFTLTKTSNSVEKYAVDVNIDYPDNTVPATKGQKEILFMAMKEVGYEWNAEKKELNKIEYKPAEWHREDEQNLNACLGYIPDEFLRRWLTDIIHVKYDKSVELPKGEDYGIDGLYAAIDILQKTLGSVDGYQSDDGILTHKCAISAVKELSKQKSSWSEEDEDMLVSIISDFAAAHKSSIGQDNWLKSLKERYTWKPSEIQLETLKELSYDVPTKRGIIEELLKQLKQL